ncbi:MAG: alpha/beta hydrolase [Bacteroidetes bacterium]|nr:alpha/beta hydrolase [Bacteroidota bacterium]
MQNGSFLLQRGSARLHYTVNGTGTPLLICPVSWGVDGHRWTTLDRLAEHFTLIRLDPRGTGGSGPVQDKEEYGIPVLVEDLDAVRVHLGLERWHVMGQSAGGWSALEYTLAHPGAVDRLAVICSAPTGKFHKGTFRDPSHPLHPRFQEVSNAVRSLPAEERVKAFNRAVYQFDVQTDEARRTIDAVFANAPFDGKRNQYFVMQELQRYDVTPRLSGILSPTLVIGGAHDAHVAPSWSCVIAEGIPGAQLVMMEQSGHFPWLDEPERFFSTITEFFEPSLPQH